MSLDVNRCNTKKYIILRYEGTMEINIERGRRTKGKKLGKGYMGREPRKR